MTQDAEQERHDQAVAAFHMAAHRRHYPAKHVILHEGDAPDALYLVLEGSVSIVIEDAQGHEMVLAYLGPGEFFGEMCLFPELQTRSARVRTRVDTVVSELGYEPFRAVARDNPEIMFVLAGQLARRLRDTSRNAIDLAFLDVSGRVARAIVNLADSDDHIPDPRGRIVKISRQELAKIVGCSREMAGRVLKTLEDDGVVEVSGRSILVLNATMMPVEIGD